MSPLPPPRPPGPLGQPPRDGGARSTWFVLRIAFSACLATAAIVVLQSLGRSGPSAPATRAPTSPPPRAADGGPASPTPTAAAGAGSPAVPGDPSPVSSTTTAVPAATGIPTATAEPDRLGAVKFHGLLDAVSDHDDVAQNQAYAVLAAHVRRLSDEEARRIIRPDLDYGTILRDPKAARGEMVRVMGLLVRFEPVRLVRGAGPEGVEDAWRGWVVDTSGDEAWVFDSLAAPPAVELRRDLVQVEGAFLKVMRYEGTTWRCPRCGGERSIRECPDDGTALDLTQDTRPCPTCGKAYGRACAACAEEEDRRLRAIVPMTRDRDVPFLIARRVSVVDESAAARTTPWGGAAWERYVIVGIGAAACAALVLALRRLARTGGYSDYLARLREKRRQR